jgi:putative phosphoesterase
VSRALDLLRERGVGCVLHCGDIDDAATVWLFAGLPTHFVFGNCDTDRAELGKVIAETGATLHEHFGSLELEGRKLAWIHGDDQSLFRDVERSGGYDFLFYGHTHHAEQHRTGPTRVVNPGALHRAKVKTFVVLDLASGRLESVAVDA